MIKVKYEVKDDRYTYICVKGHANFDEYGKDLICASVSSIMFGLMNACDELKDSQVVIKEEENLIEIVNNSDNQKLQNYFELVIYQLKTIEESYSNFIKLERK